MAGASFCILLPGSDKSRRAALKGSGGWKGVCNKSSLWSLEVEFGVEAWGRFRTGRGKGAELWQMMPLCFCECL